MKNYKNRYISIILANILVLFSILIILEIIFGYWFKKNNFGYHMRSERNKIIKFSVNHHDNKQIDFIHKRNFYGFIGKEFDPSNVKIIFEGGSTGAEIWKPQDSSIVELLNKLLIQDNLNKRIYNASVNGKSIRGYIHDFNHWFNKIPNFNPEQVIFYVGINDRYFHDDELHRFYDQQHSLILTKKIRDYIKNNSYFLGLIKKIENKYFPKNVIAYNKNKKNLYDNFQFIDYKKASSLFSTIDNEDIEYLKILNHRLKELNKIIIENNIKPTFITQIKYDGVSEKRLFLVNEEIKKFSKIFNYQIIPLDELIQDMEIGDFFDEYHTTISGSKKIASVIYKYLKL